MPADNGEPPVTRIGDIWELGPHRLICGDSLMASTCEALMQGEKAEMVFTDPPYNVPIDGHVGGLGKTTHREFAMASGEMTSDEFTQFLAKAFANLATNSVDGSIHFICMDWRHMQEVLKAGEATYSELKNLIVWAKDNGGMGTFYRSRHELVFAFKNGMAPHINTFELGQHGRYRTNVWQYRGVNTLKAGRMDELALHPTVKPVAMIADAIKDVSQPQWHRPRSLWRQRLDPDRGSQDRAAGLSLRTRSCLLRPDRPALASLCQGRCNLRRYGQEFYPSHAGARAGYLRHIAAITCHGSEDFRLRHARG